MHKQDLVLNNLQQLICHKTKRNETKQIIPISLFFSYTNLVFALSFPFTHFFSFSLCVAF